MVQLVDGVKRCEIAFDAGDTLVLPSPDVIPLNEDDEGVDAAGYPIGYTLNVIGDRVVVFATEDAGDDDPVRQATITEVFEDGAEVQYDDDGTREVVKQNRMASLEGETDDEEEDEEKKKKKDEGEEGGEAAPAAAAAE